MTDTWELVGSIRKSLTAIRDHYDATLNGPRRAGNNVGSSGHKEPPAPISLHILDARRDTHSDLAHYARIILMAVSDIEGHAIGTPVDGHDPIALTRFIDTWAERLTNADPVEAAGCDRDMAKHARELRALALPDRRDWMALGSCPLQVPTDDGDMTCCGGQVRAKLDDQQEATCQGCGTVGSVDWWEDRMFDDPELRRTLTAPEVVLFVHRTFGKVITEAAVRQWVKRGVIESSGTDDKGRTVFARDALLYALDKRQRTTG